MINKNLSSIVWNNKNIPARDRKKCFWVYYSRSNKSIRRMVDDTGYNKRTIFRYFKKYNLHLPKLENVDRQNELVEDVIRGFRKGSSVKCLFGNLSKGLCDRYKTLLWLIIKKVKSIYGGNYINVTPPTYINKRKLLQNYCVYKLFWDKHKDYISTTVCKIFQKRKNMKYYKLFISISNNPLEAKVYHIGFVKNLSNLDFAMWYIKNKIELIDDDIVSTNYYNLRKILFGRNNKLQ